jgi:protein arginine kinase activator
MKRKCDKCNRPATVHMVEIVKGQKQEKHLCDAHAEEEGLAGKSVNNPVNELLTNFVKVHSGLVPQPQEASCEECGMAFSEFREKTLLGCPSCYRSFEKQMGPLLERAHGGGTHHIGKVPRRAGVDEHRQQLILQMRKRLEHAVEGEDYELAARLRDEIRRVEESS